MLDAGERDRTWDAGVTAATATVTNAASIGDFTWIDLDADGIQDGGEPVLADVAVTLYDIDGFSIASAMTDATGLYLFDNLTPNTDYSLRFTPPPGYRRTAQDSGSDTADSDADPVNGLTVATTLTNNESDLTWDAGFIPTFSLGNFVWDDLDDDGLHNGAEGGIDGVPVRLYLDVNNDDVADGGAVASTTTNAQGYYLFDGLDAGSYLVELTPPSGYVSSGGTVGSASGSYEPAGDPDSVAVDSDDNGTAASSVIRSRSVTVTYAGEPTGEPSTPGLADGTPDADANLTVDFGLYRTLELGNKVWHDSDADGTIDGGEPVVAGATVRLYVDADLDAVPDGAAIASSTTDLSGHYLFGHLTPGAYLVEVDNRTPTIASVANPLADRPSTAVTSTNPNDDVDSDDNGSIQTPTGIRSGIVALTTGGEPTGEVEGSLLADRDSNLTVDFGFVDVPATPPPPPSPGTYDLALAKIVGPGQQLIAGGNVVFQLFVRNQGSLASGPVTIADQLPTGMTFVGASDGGGVTGGTITGGVVSWSIADIPAGTTMTLELTVRLTDSTLASYDNWAEITGDSGDDEDSTPDANTGRDATAPNDAVVDQTNAEIDVVSGDEDDNDLARIDGSQIVAAPVAPTTTLPPTNLPTTGADVAGWLLLGGGSLGIGLVLRRRRRQGSSAAAA